MEILICWQRVKLMFKIAILQKRAINAQIAKGKVDDSIMRVRSKEIASELMEIIFGDNGGKDNLGREKN